MKLLSAAEMKEIDRRTSSEYLIPSIVLMENAGIRTMDTIEAILNGVAGRSFVILAGRGNNGGDGLVIARHLINSGAEVNTFLLGEVEALSPDALINYRILEKMQAAILPLKNAADLDHFMLLLMNVDLVVDAIYGIGFKGSLDTFASQVVKILNWSRTPVLAVDIPSGLEADTGKVHGEAVKADYTVTFALPKLGLIMDQSRPFVGQLTVADISIPGDLLQTDSLKTQLITEDMVKSWLKPRRRESHKGSYGHALVIGGSPGMSGAAIMASWAALRTGSGLVTVAVPESMLPFVDASVPELMSRGLPETIEGAISTEAWPLLESLLGTASVCAIGPGMSRYSEANALLHLLLENAGIPVLIDADGLNALKGDAGILKNRQVPIVITPHPGEMSRLLNIPVEEIQQNRYEIARHFACEWGITIVLKGNNTVVASPTGHAYININGNPGMATAGSGDVLSGIITGLIAQGVKPTQAAVAGVYLHGRAGDQAASQNGQRALTATDLIQMLPGVLLGLENI